MNARVPHSGSSARGSVVASVHECPVVRGTRGSERCLPLPVCAGVVANSEPGDGSAQGLTGRSGFTSGITCPV